MDFFFSSSDSQEWPLVWRTVSLIILQELDSVIASPVSRMFWVRLGPTLIGSRFSRASRCGPVNEEDSSCPSRMCSERLRCHEGGGRGGGLVCYSHLKMEPKIAGICHQAGRTWQISIFSVPDLWQLFFISASALLLLSAGLSFMCARDIPPVTSSRRELGSSPCSVSWGSGKPFCQAEGHRAPLGNQGGGSPEQPRSLLCCQGYAASTLRLPFSLALVLILHQIYFDRVTPKVHRHAWALSQAGVPACWPTEFQLCKLDNKKTKQLNRR